ncbi:class I SAM-dependent methyltransferase [Yeosuana marina]|uniref:class I SAM-dependent methyltransferase n=1 Tax=Yeosuana marina TaxID=1565536 RepID=UPI0014202273|nr:class I SAM-dependent methyltransferase [Yeosuana marina]
MNTSILNIKIQDFITENTKSEITSILLKGTQFTSVETKEIIEQIEAKKKCEHKLPTWFKIKKIYYPNKLNIEQTSSEVTAKYKSKLIEGNTIIDLTGGFGVDCYYFSRQFKHVVHCELDTSLSEIVDYNYKQLHINNIKTHNINGLDFISQSKQNFDWVYVDPSRRHDSKGKVFFLNDCLPNIPKHLDTIFKHTNNIMIKTSPLLDVSIGISELKFVKSIHVVAVNNEVKELLWILEQGYTNEITVKTVNIKKEDALHFDFLLEEEKKQESPYSQPLSYLYEPNSAVLKAGAFNSIAKQFDVYKLHKHSHLYTNSYPIEFPGRQFKIEQVVPYHIKSIKKLGIEKANITTRNFLETVQQIRKKLKLKDGGDIYLFFTTDNESNRIVIITSKI